MIMDLTPYQKIMEQLKLLSDKGGAEYNPFLIMNEPMYNLFKENLLQDPDVKMIISEIYRHKLLVSQFFKEQEKPKAYISPFNLHLQLGQYRTMNPGSEATIEDLLSPKALTDEEKVLHMGV